MNDVAISRRAPLTFALAFVVDVIIGERLVQVLRFQLQELGVVLRRSCSLSGRVLGLHVLRLLRSKRRGRSRDRTFKTRTYDPVGDGRCGQVPPSFDVRVDHLDHQVPEMRDLRDDALLPVLKG